MNATPSTAVLAASTTMSAVTLAVADLDRMIGYYHLGVGLGLIAQDGDSAVLGHGAEPVLVLKHAPELSRAAQGSAGLFHTAILFDTEGDLASAVYSIATKFPQSFTGSSDHLVSKAFYFDDPEGNGVELYWDRPRASWSWKPDSTIEMGTLYLDPNAFLQENLTEELANQVSGGPATVGHVHLQVGSIPVAEEFYVNTVGFDITARYGSQALFVSAGGYHHHLGMNTWNSSGAGRRAPALGLGQLAVVVPDAAEIEAIASRLQTRGIATEHEGATLRFEDPWANRVAVSLGA